MKPPSDDLIELNGPKKGAGSRTWESNSRGGTMTGGRSVPLAYLFITAIGFKRPFLYFIQIGLMITYLVVELMLDYILKVDFRQNQRIVIPYIMLFFSGTGGMIGVASHAGKVWIIVTVISFLIMTRLSFVQHYITGQ